MSMNSQNCLWRYAVSACVFAIVTAAPAWASEDFLPPERAFVMEARALDAKTVEIRFKVAEGYYLYREPFKFVAEPGVQLGAAQLPAGKVLFDETFQKKVETYRGLLTLRVPVSSAPSSFKLTVTSQGCADAGLCYPPMQTPVIVSLVGFGGQGTVKPADDNDDALPGRSTPSRSGTRP